MSNVKPGQLIGYIVLDKPTVFHNARFETASMWVDTEVPAGKYELRVGDWGYHNRCMARLPGVIVDDFYQNRLMGHASSHSGTKKGQPFTESIDLYDYYVAEIVKEKGGQHAEFRIELLPEITIEEEHLISDLDGKPWIHRTMKTA